LQAENKNHLSTQSRHGFGRAHKITYQKTDIWTAQSIITILKRQGL
jgi:hypothetical protein